MLPLPDSACPLPGQVPSHQLDESDLNDFVFDSVVKDPHYFVATDVVTQLVKQHGADFDKVLPGKPTTGWWLKKQPEQLPGYQNTKVALNLKKPFHALDQHDLAALADNVLQVPVGGWPNSLVKAQAMRKHLLDQGYDHVVLAGSGELVVLKHDAYKVVVGQKSPAPSPSPFTPLTATPGKTVEYVPAKPGDVQVGTLVKSPGGTGPVVEMKGKAWAKVQGASPAWHKVETTQLVLESAAPAPPDWVPAKKGELKVGDKVKTAQGVEATVTGFQGQAWVSLQGSTKKWHPVTELQVPAAGKPGAPAPTLPSPAKIVTPADIQAAALAKAKADAALVGPAGHGLEPGVTKIQDTVTGKVGTIGFVSSSGFTINYPDGSLGAGSWAQFSAGGVTKVGPLTHPAPPPTVVPVTSTPLVDKTGKLLSTGDAVKWAGESGHVVGVGTQPGYVLFKNKAGEQFQIKAAQVVKEVPAAVGEIEFGAKVKTSPAWVPAQKGQVQVGTKVLSPSGEATVVEMQGKAWAKLEGVKPAWQKVEHLKVAGAAVPGSSPPLGVNTAPVHPPVPAAYSGPIEGAPAGSIVINKFNGKAYKVLNNKGKTQMQVFDLTTGESVKVYTGNFTPAPASAYEKTYPHQPSAAALGATTPATKATASATPFTDKLGQKYGPGDLVIAPDGSQAVVLGPGKHAGEVLLKDEEGGSFSVPIKTAVLLQSSSGVTDTGVTAGSISDGPRNYQNVDNDPKWANGWALRLQNLTSTERAAAVAYTGSSYSGWNRQLRNSKGDPGNYASRIRALDKAMYKMGADRDIIVYRGASRTGVADWTQMIGSYYTDHAYQSTSVDPNRAFGGDVKFTFKVPRGTPGMYVSAISQFGSEREFLLARGTRVRIISAKRVGSQWHVEAEVDPDPNQPRP